MKKITLNSSLDTIYRTYYSKVLSYIRTHVNDRDEADNLVSEIFEKIVCNYNRFDPKKSSIATWVFAISRNSLIDYYKHKAVVGINYDVDDYASKNQLSEQDEKFLTYENLDQLAIALRKLKERDRNIIVMRYYYGFDLNEIAAKMNLTYANVRVIQMRALAAMKSTLLQIDNV